MARICFKVQNPLEKRLEESARIRKKYPDRIPVICLLVSLFMLYIKRIKLGAEKAIFVFINNTLPPTAALMSATYQERKDEDGFLYMTYSEENTFGYIKPNA